MITILERDDIPYPDLKQQIFNNSGRQKIIPFLGAGASISERSFGTPNELPGDPPDQEAIREALRLLGFQGRAETFMKVAIWMAHVISHIESGSKNSTDTLQRLKEELYPPTATELAQLFSELSRYMPIEETVRGFAERLPPEVLDRKIEDLVELTELLTKITGIGSSSEPLSSISNYYEVIRGRKQLWEKLTTVFSCKQNVTEVHRMLARAAQSHLRQERLFEDYLIITTNYDKLMEKALEEVGVPYVILTMSRSDGKIHARFSENVKAGEDYEEVDPALPNLFFMTKSIHLAIIYKIHGHPYGSFNDANDDVIITDGDYTTFISRMSANNGVIPGQVGTIITGKPFLFLGYSLKDWNVRSIFETITKRRGSPGSVVDYSVMLSWSRYDEAFFKQLRLDVIKTDLKSFALGISSNGSER